MLRALLVSALGAVALSTACTPPPVPPSSPTPASAPTQAPGSSFNATPGPQPSPAPTFTLAATPEPLSSLTPAATAAPTPARAATPTPTAPAPIPGRWVPVPNVPVAAWSAALLPTGTVLLFQGGSSMFLYDPQTRRFRAGPASRTNLFCAGLAFLADGRLLVAGGHEGRDPEGHFLGVKSAEVLDPWQERWARVPDMVGGERWYPTVVTLPDGKALVASGTHAGRLNEVVEVLDPGAMAWAAVAKKRLPIYPWAAVMPRGEVLFFGPQRQAELLDPAQGAFRGRFLSALDRSGGTGVLLDPQTGRVLALGGGKPITRSAELFEPSAGLWKATASMAHARNHPNGVLLPDGRVLVVGGHEAEGETGKEEEAKSGEPMPAELFDPERGAWQEAATTLFGHGYHSVALLLPDGSVMAAGPLKTMELYFPWFFSWPRPALEDAPAAVRYGQAFPVKTPDASRTAKVVAIRLGSVTHSLNTDQRYVELEFARSDDGLIVKAPPRPALAPPGYYLLFIVTAQRVPSEGRLVQFR